MMHRRIALAMSLGVFAGCSLLPPLGELSGAGPGDEDASDVDDVTINDSSTADGATDGGASPRDAATSDGELLTNGGFEAPALGCGPDLRAVNAITERTGMARTGSHACQVCSTSASDDRFGLAREEAMPGSYELRGHARLVPDGGIPELETFIQISESDGGAYVDSVRTAGPLSLAWKPFQLVAILKSGETGSLFLGASGPPGSCFMVDDVSFVHQP